MSDASLKGEARYGMPAADLVLVNRHYSLGYSYYFRQAKWALEIVDRHMTPVDRLDNFRADHRVPEMFRADLQVYEGSGFHRGHLVPSADKRETELQNSETFLLSNMSPQAPGFNSGIWKQLEDAARDLDALDAYVEVYVISGPIFYFDQATTTIGNEAKGVTLPIPHAYFKSILAEKTSGRFHMWSFLLDNKASDAPLASFRVATSTIEQYSGLRLWALLQGSKMQQERRRVRKMWG